MYTYVFFYQNMNMGGCQVLISNLANKLKKDGNDVVICCEFVDECFKKSIDSTLIKSFGKQKWKSDKEIKNFLNKIDNPRYITFLWEDYSRIYSLTRCHTNILFYAVHYDAIKFAAYSDNKVLRHLRRCFLKTTILHMCNSNCIVAMDERTIERATEYYNLDLKGINVIRIPTEISENDFEWTKIVNKYRRKEIIILAVARADFPFKGYLLGLINLFKDGLVPDNCRLHIISYGKDFDLLEKAIDKIDISRRNQVILQGETPYSTLLDYIKEASLYVGMGTTLLDASKCGTISIPSQAYTYDVLCSHFFHDSPTFLGVENGEKQGLCKLIQTFANMTDDSKIAISKKCRDIAVDMYGIQKSVDELTATFEKMRLYHDIRIEFSYYFRKLKRRIQQLVNRGKADIIQG